MKLTIDISDDLYNGIVKNEYGLYNGKFFDMMRGGTPLPKGHGRLIDANVLQEEMEKDVRRAMSFVDLTEFVWLAPTVIKEDNEE